MNRRQFSYWLTALAATSLFCGNVFARRHPAVMRRLIRAPALKSGAVVGLIAPGGVVDDSIIQSCVKNLESLGFTVKPGASLRAARGGYAGTVAQRIADLHAMFEDREVAAIWTARGGSGCTSLLPHIRYDLIRRHPKILIGYSDITALHLALYRRAGLVTFHGPVAWSTPNDYAVSQMQAVLMNPRSQTEIYMSVENERKVTTQSEFSLRTFRHGVAEGRLIGGNLSVLSALIGTPYAAEIENHLVFLEDVREPPYRIDRMLTQLQQSVGNRGERDGLKRAAGIMLGVFSRSRATDSDASLTLEEVLDDHFAALPIPAVSGYSFGHIAHQFTIPMGINARLDTQSQTLTLLEAAVQG
ncbi:MAG: LD-carboxypeptidase [Burkholderiales bacterium]|nr:LD-carboxypeptidase [Burkholderiales bacterium]